MCIYRVSQRVIDKLNMLVCHMTNKTYVGTCIRKCKRRPLEGVFARLWESGKHDHFTQGRCWRKMNRFLIQNWLICITCMVSWMEMEELLYRCTLSTSQTNISEIVLCLDNCIAGCMRQELSK